MKLKACIAAFMVTVIHLIIIKNDFDSNTQVTYLVKSQHASTTQLYWKTHKSEVVLHENLKIKPFPDSSPVSFKIDNSSNKITIVPILVKGKFSIDDIYIQRSGLMINLPFLSKEKLLLSEAIEIKNIQKTSVEQFQYESQTQTPIVTFKINTLLSDVKFFVVNFFISCLILVAGSSIYANAINKKHNRASTAIIPHAIIFLLLPLLFLFSKLSFKFNNPFSNIEFITMFTISSYCLYILATYIKKRQLNTIATLIFAFLIYVITPDLGYKLGFTTIKPYIVNYTPIYHWRLDNSIDTYITQSGYAYRQDIKEIMSVIEPDNSFISDQTTSYYVLAFLPLFSAVAKAHHGGLGKDENSPFVSSEFQKYLCGTDELYKDKSLKTYFSEKQKLHRSRGWPEIKYILLNKDLKNRYVNLRCLTANNQNTQSKVNSIGNLIYQGNHLDLYEIDLNS